MRRGAILGAAFGLSGCAEGTDYGALWIEHGPGWWPVLGLVLLVAWLARKKGFLDGLTELSAFGVQLKRDVGRVDDETVTLAEEIAALRASVAKLEAEAAKGGAGSMRGATAGSRRPRTQVDFGGGGDPFGMGAAADRDAEPRLRVRLWLSGGLSDAAVPGRAEREVEIGGRPFVIGRDASADWSVTDEDRRISRRHLELSVMDGRLTVCDRSANGTGLNDPGELLVRDAPAPLEDRAVLHLGAGTVGVEVLGASATPTGRDAAEDAAAPAAPAPEPMDPGAFEDLLKAEFGTKGGGVASLSADAAAAETARRVDALLADPRFEWRSLGRVAAEVGMEEAGLRDWLAARPERYRLGESAGGRPLVRRRVS